MIGLKISCDCFLIGWFIHGINKKLSCDAKYNQTCYMVIFQVYLMIQLHKNYSMYNIFNNISDIICIIYYNIQ